MPAQKGPGICRRRHHIRAAYRVTRATTRTTAQTTTPPMVVSSNNRAFRSILLGVYFAVTACSAMLRSIDAIWSNESCSCSSLVLPVLGSPRVTPSSSSLYLGLSRLAPSNPIECLPIHWMVSYTTTPVLRRIYHWSDDSASVALC
jgi:hypothetical protein